MKKISRSKDMVMRFVRVDPVLDMKLQIKLIKEKANLKLLKAHTLTGLTRRLYEKWVAGEVKL